MPDIFPMLLAHFIGTKPAQMLLAKVSAISSHFKLKLLKLIIK